MRNNAVVFNLLCTTVNYIYKKKKCVDTVFLDALRHAFRVFEIQASELGKRLLVIPLIRLL